MTTISLERAELIFALRTIGEVIENTKDTDLRRDWIKIWVQIKYQAVKVWNKSVCDRALLIALPSYSPRAFWL